MATSYSGLKTEIADFYERNDLTSVVGTFIALCESEMQRELKLLTFETTSTISVTSGAGTLPTGLVSFRSVAWAGSPDRLLRYVTPDELARANASDPAYVNWYTITGSSIKTSDDQTGTLNVTYQGSFTPLSDSNTSNAILAAHPSVYLYGSLVHAAVYCKDFEGAIAYRRLFDNELGQIRSDNMDRKFSGPLVVRVA